MQTRIGLILMAVITLTRTQHFGGAFAPPDATLAALFLGGLLLGRWTWFACMLGLAFAVDGWAILEKGVSDFCVTQAYFGLIPTYALVWQFGSFAALSQCPVSTKRLLGFGAAGLSLAFVVSNLFWYAFSGYFAQTGLLEFAGSVARYYPPYVGYALLYLGLYLATWQTARSVIVR